MEDTVQIIVAAAVLYAAYSWFFKGKPEDASGAAQASASASSSPAAGGPVLGQGAFRHVTPAMVDNVTAAFPAVPRENVIYDLSRTRSAQATAEKLLATGFLPAPPPGLFPPPAPTPARPSDSAALSSTAASPAAAAAAASPAKQSLIDRFDLRSRAAPGPSAKGKERAEPSADDAAGAHARGNAAKWEASAEAREASLRRRKEEMVLEARRRLLAKRAKEAGGQ